MTMSTRNGLRQRLMDSGTRSVLLARLADSAESEDAYTELNSSGYGRIRRFNSQSLLMNTGRGLVPRRKIYRTLTPANTFCTQVYQLAGCNWRCWYCFVDDSLLAADQTVSRMTPVKEMVDMYLDQSNPPPVLDLSGGQPELVPEWTLWTMEEIESRGLRGRVHVWVDDNLSGSYMRSVLSTSEISYIASFPNYSHAGCLKGLDDTSVRATTGSRGSSFHGQLRVLDDLLSLGFDPVVYLTMTGPFDASPESAVRQAVRDIQRIHPLLPLKVIPLEIRNFSATTLRSKGTRENDRLAQYAAVASWENALSEIYELADLQIPPDEICLLGTCPAHPG